MLLDSRGGRERTLWVEALRRKWDLSKLLKNGEVTCPDDSWVELSELTGHLYSPSGSIIWWPHGWCGGLSPMTQSVNSLTFSDPATSPLVSTTQAYYLPPVSFPAASCALATLNPISVPLPNAIFSPCDALPDFLFACQTSTYCPTFSSRIISWLKFVSSPFLCTSSFLPFRVGQCLFLL